MKDTPIDEFGPYPGYWTELVILHDWPPGWKPSVDWGKNLTEHSAAATRGRETQLANGIDGSIAGISRLSDVAIENYRARHQRVRT